MAEIPPFFLIGGELWIKKMVNYLSRKKGKGELKDIHCNNQNAALNVSLL